MPGIENLVFLAVSQSKASREIFYSFQWNTSNKIQLTERNMKCVTTLLLSYDNNENNMHK